VRNIRKISLIKFLLVLVTIPILITLTDISSLAAASAAAEVIEVDKKAKLVSPCERIYEVELSLKGNPTPKPLDIVLVIDRSGSMDRDGRMTSAKNAAKAFAQQIIQSSSNNRISIVSFSSEATIDRTLTNNLNNINSAINGLNPNGSTNIYDGLVKANQVLAGARADAAKSIVLLSDGIANRPTQNNNPNYPITQAINEAATSKNRGYLVFTVGLFNGLNAEDKQTAVNTLTQIASPGNYYDSATSAQLTEIYLKIANSVNYAAKEAVIKDILSDEIRNNFTLDTNSFKIDGVPVALGGVENRVLYDSSTGTITWNLGTLGNESKKLTYNVKAKDSYGGSNGEMIFTNKNAEVGYKDINNASQKKIFPMPKIKVPAALRAEAGSDRTVHEGDSVVLGGNPTAIGGFGTSMNWTTLPDGTVTWIDNNLNTTGSYTYKWFSKKAGTANWTEFSSVSNPTVTPAEDTEYKVEVRDFFGRCVATDQVTLKVQKFGEFKVKIIVLDENGNDISNSIEDEFYLKATGVNGQRWNIIQSSREIKNYSRLPLGNYSVLPDYISEYYQLISIKNKTGIDITSTGSILLSESNRNEEVIITLKVKKPGGFTDNEKVDNIFPVIK